MSALICHARTFSFPLREGLLPALWRAREAGVMAVLSAGRGCKVDLDDLGLKEGHTGQGGAYTDLMIEELASRSPTISFTHTFSRWVKTPLFGFPTPPCASLWNPSSGSRFLNEDSQSESVPSSSLRYFA
ncbi:hypothetical protein B0H13DRAFT_2375229 [Mycena leptocephala]|nr:hypothetical protein B0H13DRAFT_2375229 [Mycena leptocephala]